MSDVKTGQTNPSVFFGFFEPDCFCAKGSSQIDDVDAGVKLWKDSIEPLFARNIPLGSPSMCKQMDETWLSDFYNSTEAPRWNITSIHVNKKTADEAKDVVNYYWNKYGKPIWITELVSIL
jgi:hypothetical protein